MITVYVLVIVTLFCMETIFYNSSYCRKRDYEKQIRETGDKFSVEECEVFQVTKINV
jgi:hypothetical protein